MKRAAITYCADVDPRRFDVLAQRDLLPFAGPVKGSGFSLEHAFRLRLMMDLVDDGEGNGLLPSYAGKAVENTVPLFSAHPLDVDLESDLWAGLILFRDSPPKASPLFWSANFAGFLADMPFWMEREMSRFPSDRPSPVRIFLANASRAARQVRERAHEMGLPEAKHDSKGGERA